MSQLFGTSGIRGPADKLFTNQFCFDIGRTFSQFLSAYDQNGPIAIGMDPRISSPRIKSAVISGLIYEKRQVYDEGVTPIPAINWILKSSRQFSGSLMISGSHIKADLNGIKFFAFEEEILKKHEAQITRIYEKIKQQYPYKDLVRNTIQESRANEAYQQYLISCVNYSLPAWKIVVDCGNGAQSDTMPEVLRRLGLEVVEINCSVQEQFLARDTEIESDYNQLKDKVKAVKADLGVGYDADGDRVVFIDEKGNYVTGDYSGTLIAANLPGDSVVTPINSSQVIEQIGKTVYRTKVGSPYVVEKMKAVQSSFGFEANGGGIFSELHSRDGGRSTIELLNILAKKGNRLSAVVGELPKYYIYRDKIEYQWELKDKIIAAAKAKFQALKTEEVDGLKIWLNENTWILFRSSMNAPEFRVFVESKSRVKAEELIKQGLDLVKSQI